MRVRIWMFLFPLMIALVLASSCSRLTEEEKKLIITVEDFADYFDLPEDYGSREQLIGFRLMGQMMPSTYLYNDKKKEGKSPILVLTSVTALAQKRSLRKFAGEYELKFFKDAEIDHKEAAIDVDWEGEARSWVLYNDADAICGSALSVRSETAFVFLCVIGVYIDTDEAWEDIAGQKVRAVLEKGKSI